MILDFCVGFVYDFRPIIHRQTPHKYKGCKRFV